MAHTDNKNSFPKLRKVKNCLNNEPMTNCALYIAVRTYTYRFIQITLF